MPAAFEEDDEVSSAPPAALDDDHEEPSAGPAALGEELDGDHVRLPFKFVHDIHKISIHLAQLRARIIPFLR